MKKISILDRILLLITSLLAAYTIAFGIEGKAQFSITCYTIAFGVLLVAGLLIIIMGFEVLDSSWVVIVSTIIPFSLSLGLVSEFLPGLTTPYLIFVILGFLAVIVTRLATPGMPGTLTLIFVHGIAGILITLLPIILAIRGDLPAVFSFVGIGGAVIGLGGLLLSFLKTGKPILSQDTILTVLPGLLLIMTGAFVVGFAAA